MSGYTIKVEGLAELQKRLGKIPENLANEVDVVLDLAANDFVNGAVEAAPVDREELRQKISSKRNGLMNYEVVSAAPYSAYIEFGTRSRVQVPSDLQTYASQFKGGGQGDAKQAIFEWCRRVGIAQEMWYPIFIKIMTVGINPHPFFFIQRGPVALSIQKRLQPAIKKALSK